MSAELKKMTGKAEEAEKNLEKDAEKKSEEIRKIDQEIVDLYKTGVANIKESKQKIIRELEGGYGMI